MTGKYPYISCFLGALSLLAAASATAFEINGPKWPGAETEFYVNISGVSATGISWNSAFIDAMDEWSEKTDFNFVLRNEYRDPCAYDNVNGVDFTTTVCGQTYGRGTLAVTLSHFAPAPYYFGPDVLVGTDIVINKGSHYDLFDGNLFRPDRAIDFRRVALHELGHALGLDHTTNHAIMRDSIGNVDRLQTDDIDGANARYGGLTACHVPLLPLAPISDSLSGGDCTVQKLMGGGTDDSFIDIYRVELDSTTSIAAAMNADTLDSVLLLANAQLEIMALDDNSGGGCNARLTRNLSPGTYYLLANTYVGGSPCGEDVGPYTLDVSYQTSSPVKLNTNVSLGGGISQAVFSGGVTANNGLQYGNRFGPDDSLDINAGIEIDPQHQGQPGFIVVAAMIDGETLLLLNEQRVFVEYTGGPITRFDSRNLAPNEAITVAENLVPRSIGITSIHVDVYVGYGLDSNPAEVYHHATPLTFTIQ
ncbi:MAG: matrixin family metalloprotease [Pseudohongiellaceae bacterium]